MCDSGSACGRAADRQSAGAGRYRSAELFSELAVPATKLAGKTHVLRCLAQGLVRRVRGGANFGGLAGLLRQNNHQATATSGDLFRPDSGCASDEGDGALAAQNSVLTQIARPYASALFDLAQAEDQLDAVEAGLDAIAALAGESADFARFLRSPVISADEQGARRSRRSWPRPRPTRPSPISSSVVARNGRLFALPADHHGVPRAAPPKARGEVTADVTSAAPLTGCAGHGPRRDAQGRRSARPSRSTNMSIPA